MNDIKNLLRRICAYIESKEDTRMMSAMTDGKRLYCDCLETICRLQEEPQGVGPSRTQAGGVEGSGPLPKTVGEASPLTDLNLAAAKFNSFPPRGDLKTIGGALIAEVGSLREKYFELLHAVEGKYEGESRHETALRYIRQAGLPAPEPKAEGSQSSPIPSLPPEKGQV